MILDSKLPIGYLLYIVKYELITVLIVGVVTHFGTIKFSGFLPIMPLTIPAFLGTSISVLLSFKMNQSYDRWWEARKIWGAIRQLLREEISLDQKQPNTYFVM